MSNFAHLPTPIILIQSLIQVIKNTRFSWGLRGNYWVDQTEDLLNSLTLQTWNWLTTVAFLPDGHWPRLSPRGQESYMCATVSWPHPKLLNSFLCLSSFLTALCFGFWEWKGDRRQEKQPWFTLPSAGQPCNEHRLDCYVVIYVTQFP